MAYPSDEKHNVEAATFEFTYRNRRQHRRTKLLIALLGGTIAFYSLLGAILICFYSDATLLALITNPRFNHRLNHLRNQWISTKSNIEKPRGVNVVAVVEYGNWERSSILDCYLRVRCLSDNKRERELTRYREIWLNMAVYWMKSSSSPGQAIDDTSNGCTRP